MDFAARDGDTVRVRLGAHVDHVRVAVFVEMGEWLVMMLDTRCASSVLCLVAFLALLFFTQLAPQAQPELEQIAKGA